MTRRLRTGVVGTGIIAQVMHLHYLSELAGQFEVAAVCDLMPDNARACAERFGGPPVFTDWRDLIAEPLDAVLVLTSGSHAPIAIAAAEAGLHVLVEKPMCFSVAEGQEMLAAAERAGTVLMVGYPKRYDPAFGASRRRPPGSTGTRLLRVTTLESPFLPYVGHYPLLPPVRRLPAERGRAAARRDTTASVAAAIGGGHRVRAAGSTSRCCWTRWCTSSTPCAGCSASRTGSTTWTCATDSVTAMLRFGSVPSRSTGSTCPASPATRWSSRCSRRTAG